MSELNLFVSERKSMALGVMTQPQGSHRQPVVSIAMLVPEALKFTSGRNLTVLISHDISGILHSKVQSDNGSLFKAAITQGVLKALGIECHNVPEDPNLQKKLKRLMTLFKDIHVSITFTFFLSFSLSYFCFLPW